MTTRKIVGLLLIVVLAILLDYVAFNVFFGKQRVHNPKVFSSPQLTQWKPVGARSAGQHGFDIIPEPDTFSAIHVGVNNSDNVWVVAAPMFELDWTAEPEYFIGAGPVLDNAGNLYFTSSFYKGARTALVAIDAQTGERRWALPADSDRESNSGPFILNDPDNPGSQIIYHVSYTRAVAMRQDGSIIWSSSTGLSLPTRGEGSAAHTRAHSFNYHPKTDSLITVTMSGKLIAFSRETGELVAPMGQVPGAPAISSIGVKIPGFLIDKVDLLMDEVFGKTGDGKGIFTAVISYLYGGGGVVTNFFSISPDSGRIFLAATAEDAEDGVEDGRSELGALYLLDLVDDGNGGLEFQILNRATFQGGTGSTPALSADGSRVYGSDNAGNVIAFDADLNEIWRLNVGEALVGSISVSPDNGELYAPTATDMIKVVDNGDSGSLAWKANLTGFDGYANVDKQTNALTATITANGVVVMIGGGKSLFGANIMLHVGIGLLDRETGELRYFAEGREDSVAMSTVGPDGSIYVASSPIRRAAGKALYPELTAELTGGITRYKPIRLDLMARDAICAAEARAANASTLDLVADIASVNTDIRQIKVLLKQAGGAIYKAVSDGDMAQADAATLVNLLQQSAANLTPAQLNKAVTNLASACSIVSGKDPSVLATVVDGSKQEARLSHTINPDRLKPEDFRIVTQSLVQRVPESEWAISAIGFGSVTQ